MAQRTLTLVQGDDKSEAAIDLLAASWLRSLRGAKSPATIRAYGYAVRGLTAFLASAGMPTDPATITTEHINAYLDHEMDTNSPATAKLRRTYLNVFFSWLAAEGELDDDDDKEGPNPVKRAKVPAVEDRPNDVLTETAWLALLDAVKGRSAQDRRDAAILRVLESSGMRRAEVAGLRISDVNLDDLTVTARVKGGRVELRVIDEPTAAAIDRWLRSRKDDTGPTRPLWVGRAGKPLSADGLAHIVRRRGAQAGIDVHAHMFRHRWAELGKASMSDENLMALGGWRSAITMRRYARANTVTRAVAEYRKSRAT